MENENDVEIQNYLPCHQLRAKKPQIDTFDQETTLNLNNLARGKSDDKNDRGIVNIATRSRSKTTIEILEVSKRSILSMFLTHISNTDSTLVTDRACHNVNFKNLHFHLKIIN